MIEIQTSVHLFMFNIILLNLVSTLTSKNVDLVVSRKGTNVPEGNQRLTMVVR